MNVCIVGTGYVGLVTAACLAETGNTVQCVDIDPSIIENLKQGKIHIFEPGLDDLVKRNSEEGRLFFTTSLDEGIKDALFVFVCVGTPPKDDGSCDYSYVHQVARDIGRTMTDYKIVVNKSTVPVGTADRVRELITRELAGRHLSLEFDVVSNPEFLKEGDAVSDFMKPDRIVIGTDNVRTTELLKALYAPYARSREKLIAMSIRSAEMTKYAANCMLAAKISFINEIANICEKVGADVREVRFGIGADQRIGYHFIYPGVGFGGSCFPKDVKALIHTAEDSGVHPELLIAVDQVNDRQKMVLPDKIEKYLAPRGGAQGRVAAIWGLAFKPNTDDMREAPSGVLIRHLTGLGMSIQAFDPVAGPKASVEYADNPRVKICGKQYEALEGADILVVVTEWHQFRNPDFPRIKEMLGLAAIFDGRNLYSTSALADLGLEHFSIGRPTRPVKASE